MNKKSYHVDIKKTGLWLALLCIFLTPLMIYAGEFYQCRDKDGNESLIDSPIEGQKCFKIGTFEENTGEQKGKKATSSTNDKITKVTVKGNQVLVPVTFVYDNTETNATLLMDTGASATAVHSEVADRLYINLLKTKKVKGGVVGGGIIDANVVKMDVIKIGPHEIYDWNVAVINHDGYKTRHEGLLGMDLLGNLSYKLDLSKQVIIWE